MIEEFDSIYDGILDGDREKVKTGVQAALDAGIGPETILDGQLIAAMDEVGQLFEDGEYFVPEMLIAANAMQAGMELLRPLLIDADIKPVGTVLIGTVKGDMHDIGKNLVSMMLEGGGFTVVDLGTNVAPDVFIQKVNEVEPDIVAMSALLTTTVPQMESTIEAFEKAGIRAALKIMVGGAPVTQALADEIGANGYAPDAGQAARLARKLTA